MRFDAEGNAALITDKDVALFLEEAVVALAEENGLHFHIDQEGCSSYDRWFSLRLRNGAQWQVQIKRYSWPKDGSSRQWEDEEGEED